MATQKKIINITKTSRLPSKKDKKTELSQRWLRDAPYIWVSWKISRVPDYTPTATFPEILMGFSTDWCYE